MSTQVVPLNKAQLPAHLRKGSEQARAVAADLSAGVTAGFPIISYRGKVWRVRKGGEEMDFTDRKGNALPSIDVVFVKSNKMPSKTYYKGKYAEGDNSPPTCWSSDGVKPDASVQEKQHNVCATCPRNAWGSRITEAGKKGRECSDVRRMAVVFADELAKKGTDAHLFLMRIPPASLNPLKDYAEKVLGPAGVEYFAVATQLGFDSGASHPKLTFRVATDDDDQPRFLTEEEYEAVQTLRDSPEADHILSEEPDYAEAGTTGANEAAARQPQKDATTPAPAPRSKPRPVDEEDVPTTDVTPRKAAPPVEDEDEDEDEAPPPPPVKAKKKAKTPAPAPESKDDEDEVPPSRTASAPAAVKGGFDDILESLLGTKK